MNYNVSSSYYLSVACSDQTADRTSHDAKEVSLLTEERIIKETTEIGKRVIESGHYHDRLSHFMRDVWRTDAETVHKKMRSKNNLPMLKKNADELLEQRAKMEVAKTEKRVGNIYSCLRRKGAFWREQVGGVNGEALKMDVDFINRCANSIMKKHSLRDREVTLISVCCDGLLLEHYLHEVLINAGYDKLNWVLIGSKSDTYSLNGETAYDEFTRLCKPHRVEAFESEQEYMKKEQGKTDSGVPRQGYAILKSSKELWHCNGAKGSPDNLLVSVSFVMDVEAANSIYVFFRQGKNNEETIKVISEIESGERHVRLRNAVVLKVYDNGKYDISISGSGVKQGDLNLFKKLLKKEVNKTNKRNGLTLDVLAVCVKNVIKESTNNSICTVRYGIDYHTCIESLCATLKNADGSAPLLEVIGDLTPNG